MKWILLLAVIFFSVAKMSAQQDAQYTQFMFNKLYFNPAYAGSKGGFCLSTIYRQQWLGIRGAPRTLTFNTHGAVAKKRVGLGLSVTSDRIGFLNNWNIETSYSYIIPIGRSFKLSIGLRGSLSVMRMRWNMASPTQTLDNSIPGNDMSKLSPNFGFGLYLEHPFFYAGLSAPHLFNNKIDFTPDSTGTANNGIEPRLERHYFLMGGAYIPMGEKVAFRPSIMLKYVPRSPFDMDINISFVFLGRFMAGVSYRLGDSIDALFQVAITPQLRLGIGYDFTLTKLQRYNAGSLEVMMEACFIKSQDLKVNNPRFF